MFPISRTLSTPFGFLWRWKHFFIPPLFVAVRYGSADYFVQTYEVHALKKPYDWKRTAKYTFFGFSNMFLLFNPMYIKVYPLLMPKLGRLAGLKVSLFDVFVLNTFFYFPYYYLINASIQAENWAETREMAYNTFRSNVMTDVLNMSKVFVPLGVVTHCIVPPQFRGYTIAIGGYVWSLFLSYSKKWNRLSLNMVCESLNVFKIRLILRIVDNLLLKTPL